MGAGAASLTDLSLPIEQIGSIKQPLEHEMAGPMPNGTTALLRDYDARITGDITVLLDPAQRAVFFAPVQEWLTQRDGQLTRIYQTHGA